jgi:NAD(P)-dependent dehydrogenase (short-subunit alcohol dehydrogenase family)
MSNWQGKVALVTGASSGLGREIARVFAAAGANVVLAARRAEPLQAVADELSCSGRAALAVPADVTQPAAVDALVAAAVDRFGRLDVLINNAGASMRRAVLDTSPDDFRQQFELNVLAAVTMTRAAAPHLLAQRGHLVNIASLAGMAPARFMGAYGPSKAALVSYTAQLRMELGPQGLHVLLVCPGPLRRETPKEYAPDELKGLPTSAAKPGGGVKTSAIDPADLARKILRACDARQPELIVPAAARLIFTLARLSPRLGDWLIRRLS